MVRRFVWKVLVGLDALLVAAVALAYAARYVHPSTGWWLDLIALALPYMSILLVPAALALVLARRWRLALLHGVLLLLVLVRYVPLDRLSPAAEPSDEDLTVLSLNMPLRWDEREEASARIVELVRGYAPELVALQEVTVAYQEGGQLRRVRPVVRMMIDSLDYARWHPERKLGMDQPVLTKVPVLEQELILLRRPDWPSATQVVRTRFRWQGREAVLYNVHLRSFGNPKPWQHTPLRGTVRPETWRGYMRQFRSAYGDRAWEADTLRAMIEQETVPALIVGDFNSTMHSWVYNRLARGFQDAFHVAGRGWGATYHSRLPLVRIDFVLASPEWRIVEARVPAVDVSDHQPLVAVLRWREAP